MAPTMQEVPDFDDKNGSSNHNSNAPLLTLYDYEVVLPSRDLTAREPEPGLLIGPLCGNFTYDPDIRRPRLVKSVDGTTEYLQLKRPLGLRQMFPSGRPDTGEAPILDELMKSRRVALDDGKEFKLSRAEVVEVVNEIFLYYSRAFLQSDIGYFNKAVKDCVQASKGLDFLEECNLTIQQVKNLSLDISIPKLWMLRTFAQVQELRRNAEFAPNEQSMFKGWIKVLIEDGIDQVKSAMPLPWCPFTEQSRKEALIFLERLQQEDPLARVTTEIDLVRSKVFPASYDLSTRMGPEFAHKAGHLNARIVDEDGKRVLQARTADGIDEMELTGRPDGERPFDFDTYLDLLKNRIEREEGTVNVTHTHYKLTPFELRNLTKEAKQYARRAEIYDQATDRAIVNHERSLSDARHALELYQIAARAAPTLEERRFFEQRAQEYNIYNVCSQEIHLAFNRGDRTAILKRIADTLDNAAALGRLKHEDPRYSHQFLQLERIAEGYTAELTESAHLDDRRLVNELRLREALRFGDYEKAARIRDEGLELKLQPVG